MTTYLHPGVYVEEIPSGSKPIEGVSTSVAAFVGVSPKGPANQAVLVQNIDDYKSEFGDVASESDAMGLAMQAFYLNGGRSAYVCRLLGSGSAASSASVVGESTGTNATLIITATSEGTWGDEVYFRIVKPSVDALIFDLEVGHQVKGEFQAIEEFTGLSMREADENYALTQVNGNSAYISLTLGPAAEIEGAGEQYEDAELEGDQLESRLDYFRTDITQPATMNLNINALGAEMITIDGVDLNGTQAAGGNNLATAIQDAVRALGPEDHFQNFTCSYNGTTRRFTLTSAETGANAMLSVVINDFTRALGLETTAASDGRVVVHGTGNVIPVQTLGLLNQGEPLTRGVLNNPSAPDFTTFFNQTLRKVRDVSIVVVPGEAWAADGSGNSILSAALAHCESLKSRVLIVDPPQGHELDQAATVDTMGLPTSTYSMLYYPWVKVANPFYHVETNPNVDKTLNIAPSAIAAGMWAKIDGKRGVWKAPAGVETQLLGAAGLEYNVGDGEQDQLNPLGVNCIRTMPSFGSVFWGSRTLSTKADPEWRYVPVRRTALFIEQSIFNGIQWAVFEGNDEPLWGSLRANIGGFMNGLFRAGAFQGGTANDAYFVRCGLGDTMTQADIDRGQVIVIVGFAPLKPAEFVIVRIQQKINQQ